MSIERREKTRVAWTTLLVTLLLIVALPGYGQQGQYRSKIRIDPNADIGPGPELSIDELENQIRSISDHYGKSSAGRHLARHFVALGEYEKAIDYYQTALAADGLSDIANREMLRELAQVYLLSEDYEAAASTLDRALRMDLVADAADFLLLAQAYYRLGKLVQVVAALDNIDERGLTLTIAQQRQALALYYQAGAYAECERLLRALLDAEPNDAESWHQLASIYLRQGKKKQALDQLTLAWEKSVPFREQDTVLLADLKAVNGDPYGGALVLEAGLSAQTVRASGRSYRKLFQLWLQAREQEQASAALVQAARLSGDIELYLHLAQLQMEEEAWQPMYQTMVAACENQLQDKYVGRANLLLGISQLKLGDEPSARRSFINATLIGGAGAQAGQWLEFMGAEPATRREAKRIVGLCHGAGDKQVAADEFSTGALYGAPGDESPPARVGDDTAIVKTKTVPKMNLFYREYDKTLAQLTREAASLARRSCRQPGVAPLLLPTGRGRIPPWRSHLRRPHRRGTRRRAPRGRGARGRRGRGRRGRSVSWLFVMTFGRTGVVPVICQELLGQSGASAGDARANGARRNVKGVGDLCVVHPQLVTKDNGRTELFG